MHTHNKYLQLADMARLFYLRMMTDNSEETYRYPIGRFRPMETFTADNLFSWIGSIRSIPLLLDYCVENMDEEQLNTPYRQGGWNSIQVIHHLADSHMNAYIRMKLALTENNPVIKPYEEQLWAGLADVTEVPVNVSITLIHALHRRWTALMDQLTAEDWKRTYIHPADGHQMPLWQMINLYSWHGQHHVEQILLLRQRNGW